MGHKISFNEIDAYVLYIPDLIILFVKYAGM